jgi:TetR/AcrR family transcriptional regulator, transcriptional repressor for nem operon
MASKIREKIIVAAAQCFAQTGYSGCATKQIAEAAHVTEGSIFRLFGSKEKVFEEAVAYSVKQRIVARDVEQLLERQKNFHRAIHETTRAYIKGIPDLSVRLLLFASLEQPDIAMAHLGTLALDLRIALAERIAREVKAGSIRRGVDPIVAAHALLTALSMHRVYAVVYAPRHGGISVRRQVEWAESIADIWLLGVLGR